MASSRHSEDEVDKLARTVGDFLIPLAEEYHSFQSDTLQDTLMELVVNNFCVRTSQQSAVIDQNALESMIKHLRVLSALGENLVQSEKGQDEPMSPPTTPAISKTSSAIGYGHDIEMRDADDDAEVGQDTTDNAEDDQDDQYAEVDVQDDQDDQYAEVDVEDDKDYKDLVKETDKGIKHHLVANQITKSHGRRRSDWKNNTNLSAAVDRVFADSTKLLVHAEDPKHQPHKMLKSVVVACCRDELKWNESTITGAQADILELIADTLSERSFIAMLATGEGLLITQSDAEQEAEFDSQDNTLSAANKDFAIALRKFQNLERKTVNNKTTSDLLTNLAYSKLASTNEKALNDMRNSVGIPAKSRRIINWLVMQLTNANLSDERGLVPKGDSKMNCVQGLRVLQYYQNIKTTSAYDMTKPPAFSAWSRTVGDDLNRGKKVECFTEFDVAIAALLPHARRKLESLRITEDSDEASKKSKPVNIILPILEAINAKLPLRQALRAVYNGLVKYVVEEKPIEGQKFKSLHSLVVTGDWSYISVELYDGQTLGYVNRSKHADK